MAFQHEHAEQQHPADVHDERLAGGSSASRETATTLREDRRGVFVNCSTYDRARLAGAGALVAIALGAAVAVLSNPDRGCSGEAYEDFKGHLESRGGIATCADFKAMVAGGMAATAAVTSGSAPSAQQATASGGSSNVSPTVAFDRGRMSGASSVTQGNPDFFCKSGARRFGDDYAAQNAYMQGCLLTATGGDTWP